MGERLQFILSELQSICLNLRKLGLERREKYKDSVENKIKNAKILFKEHLYLVKSLDVQYVQENAYFLELLTKDIDLTFKKILGYEIKSDIESVTMDKFDIKTAAALIPMMNGTEEITEKMIDAIQMYDSCLKEQTCKVLLISFVLKTRISKTAKLKLKQNYTTVTELITDIQKHLLTKQSASSLLTQINNISQKEMTIKDYANKLETMFVDLTISQANSKPEAYEILRPINEKLAVKKFADGLRNRRLSTIISARDYSDFKDAVRAAEDEDSAQPPQGTVLNYRGKRNYFPSNMYRQNYSQGYGYSSQRPAGHRGYGNFYRHPGGPMFHQQANRYIRPSRPHYQSYRGRVNTYKTYRGGRHNSHQAYTMQQPMSHTNNPPPTSSTQENVDSRQMQFFRP